MDLAGLAALREEAARVYVSDPVLDYVIRLVNATRTHPLIAQGASPRATLALVAVSRALALSAGRDYVLPQDVASVFYDVIAHRLVFAPQAGRTAADRADLLRVLVRSVKAPRIR